MSDSESYGVMSSPTPEASSSSRDSQSSRPLSAIFRKIQSDSPPRMSRTSKAIKHIDAVEGIMLFFLFVELIAGFVFLFFQDDGDRSNRNQQSDPTETTSPSSYILEYQYLFAVFSLITSAILLILCFKIFVTEKYSMLSIVIAIRLFSIIFFDFPSLANPTVARAWFLGVLITLKAIEVIIFLILFWQNKSQLTSHSNTRRQRLATVAAPISVSTTNLLRQKEVVPQVTAEWFASRFSSLSDYIQLTSLRSDYRHAMVRARRYFYGISLCILALCMVNFFFEFRRIVSASGEHFSQDEINTMRTEADPCDSFTVCSNGEVTPSDQRTVLIILDGCRSDFVFPDAYVKNGPVRNKKMDEFRKFITPNSIFNKKTSLSPPSMSVPHWIALISGARPEMSGVLGNLLVPEIKYDHLFSLAKKHGNLRRGLTASPWMGDITRSTLMSFASDGTVPTSFGSEGLDYATADAADNERGRIAVEALNTTIPADQYNLFLIHWSDIDIQGHALGVDPPYNPKETYSSAITNKTLLLYDIVQVMEDIVDTKTVIAITADHGHLTGPGGHGGNDQELVNVPLMLYKRGWTPNTTHPFTNRYRKAGEVNQVDIPTTLAAIMGLPVPRQSQGLFIDGALELFPVATRDESIRDLFVQKKVFLKHWLSSINYATFDSYSVTKLDPQTADLNDLISGAGEIVSIYQSTREEFTYNQILRNILLALLLSTITIAMVVYIFQTYTFADHMLTFYAILHQIHKMLNFCRLPNKMETLARKCYIDTTFVDPDNTTMLNAVKIHRHDLEHNFLAMRFAFGFICLYYGLCLGIYNLAFVFIGYENFDSTVIHTSAVVPRYLFIALFPPAVIYYIITHSYHSLYTRFLEWPKSGVLNRITVSFTNFMWFLSPPLHRLRFQMVYLIRYWILLFTLYSALTLLIFQSTFAFAIPIVYRVSFFSVTWALRFRVLTAMLMSMPLMVGSLLALRFPIDEPTTSSMLDPVYALRLRKDQRWVMNHSGQKTARIKWDINDPHYFSKSRTQRFEGLNSALTTFDLRWCDEGCHSTSDDEENENPEPELVADARELVSSIGDRVEEVIDTATEKITNKFTSGDGDGEEVPGDNTDVELTGVPS